MLHVNKMNHSVQAKLVVFPCTNALCTLTHHCLSDSFIAYNADCFLRITFNLPNPFILFHNQPFIVKTALSSILLQNKRQHNVLTQRFNSVT